MGTLFPTWLGFVAAVLAAGLMLAWGSKLKSAGLSYLAIVLAVTIATFVIIPNPISLILMGVVGAQLSYAAISVAKSRREALIYVNLMLLTFTGTFAAAVRIEPDNAFWSFAYNGSVMASVVIPIATALFLARLKRRTDADVAGSSDTDNSTF